MKKSDAIGLVCGLAAEFGALYILMRLEGPLMALVVSVGVTGMVIWNCAGKP